MLPMDCAPLYRTLYCTCIQSIACVLHTEWSSARQHNSHGTFNANPCTSHIHTKCQYGITRHVKTEQIHPVQTTVAQSSKSRRTKSPSAMASGTFGQIIASVFSFFRDKSWFLRWRRGDQHSDMELWDENLQVRFTCFHCAQTSKLLHHHQRWKFLVTEMSNISGAVYEKL